MTNLFRCDVGEMNAFQGDLAQAGFEAEDLRFLRQNKKVLTEMVELVHRARRVNILWEKVNETTIRVNLSAAPKLPFQPGTVEWNNGSGWVTIERKGDDLYVEGRKIHLFLTEGQKTGSVRGYDLRKQIDMARALHANILDALFENVHLIPDSWKVDSLGRTRFICFWATGYRDSSGSLCVRCLCWGDGPWLWDCRWLGDGFDVRSPAALSAS